MFSNSSYFLSVAHLLETLQEEEPTFKGNIYNFCFKNSTAPLDLRLPVPLHSSLLEGDISNTEN